MNGFAFPVLVASNRYLLKALRLLSGINLQFFWAPFSQIAVKFGTRIIFFCLLLIFLC